VSEQASLAGTSPRSDTLLFADPSLETADLLNVEILSVGTWTTMAGQQVTFTQADLEELASNFHALADRVKPPLKLGHEADDKQELLTGQPALGWMENVRHISGKLRADFMRVPKKFHALVEAGAYRRISAEIARNWTDSVTGKTYGAVIKAAGVLGAAAPAISNLRDLMNLYGRTADGELVATQVYALADPIAQGGLDMLNDTQVAKLLADVESLKTAAATNQQFSEGIRKALGIDDNADPVAAIASLKKKAVDSADILAQAADEKFAGEVDEIITKAKKDGKLLPAGESAVRLMVKGWAREADENEGVLSFSVTDAKSKKEKNISGSVTECLTAYFSAQPQVLRIGTEFGPGQVSRDPAEVKRMIPRDVASFVTEGHKQVAIDTSSLKRHAAVEAHMRENPGTNYFTAFHKVTDQYNDANNE